MSDLDDLLKIYAERFKENFPFFLVMGMSDEEMRKQLEESLETGKPFRPEMDPDKIY